MRFAAKRSSSGWTVRSFLPTMYQLGFDFQAVPSTPWLKMSAAGAKVVWATHFAPAADIFNHGVDGTAWKSKPSWYIVGKNDRTVHPELERFAAKRMGATTYELESSHVPMLSQPERVIDVIRTAAKAVQAATANSR